MALYREDKRTRILHLGPCIFSVLSECFLKVLTHSVRIPLSPASSVVAHCNPFLGFWKVTAKPFSFRESTNLEHLVLGFEWNGRETFSRSSGRCAHGHGLEGFTGIGGTRTTNHNDGKANQRGFIVKGFPYGIGR